MKLFFSIILCCLSLGLLRAEMNPFELLRQTLLQNTISIVSVDALSRSAIIDCDLQNLGILKISLTGCEDVESAKSYFDVCSGVCPIARAIKNSISMGNENYTIFNLNPYFWQLGVRFDRYVCIFYAEAKIPDSEKIKLTRAVYIIFREIVKDPDWIKNMIQESTAAGIPRQLPKAVLEAKKQAIEAANKARETASSIVTPVPTPKPE